MKHKGRLAALAAIFMLSCVSGLAQPRCPAERPVACPSPPPAAAAPSCPDIKDINSKWDLWRTGTCLRGANVWQKRITPKHGMGAGPVGPPYIPGEPGRPGDFARLKDLGTNYVNISHPGVFPEQPPYHFDEAVFAHLDGLIKMAEQAELFVVISFRTGPLRNEAVFDKSEGKVVKEVWLRENEEAREAWVRMWVETALRLKCRKVVVGYDLMVEPDTTDHTLWNEMAAKIAGKVREVDKQTPIIVGAANWSHVASLEGLVPTGVPMTVYAVHQYEPYDYTHREDNKGFKDGKPEKLAASLNESYRQIAAFRAKHGGQSGALPMVANEFGLFRWAPNAGCFMRYQFALLERDGMNHALWLWETSSPLVTYDQFNFRRGPDKKNKQDCATSDLIEAIKANWRLNTVRPKDVISKFPDVACDVVPNQAP